MEKLTEAELAALPRSARVQYAGLIEALAIRNIELAPQALKDKALIERMARALAPQPCGHPGACVVSVPYIGENKSNHCGWCADVSGYEALKEHHSDHHVKEDVRQALAAKRRPMTNSDRLEEYITIKRKVLCQAIRLAVSMEAECDALREKLKAADADLEGSIEFNRDVAAENLKLEAELGHPRLNEAAYLRGQEEIKRDQDRLRARLIAAKGLAEALQVRENITNVDLHRDGKRYHPQDIFERYITIQAAMERQALIAWKAAND